MTRHARPDRSRTRLAARAVHRAPVTPLELLVAFALLVLLLAAARPSQALDPACANIPMSQYGLEDAEIDAAVLEELCNQRLVGAAVGIVKDGEVVYARGYGWEDLRGYSLDQARQSPTLGVPLHPAITQMFWGSVSKTLTAVSVMQQRNRGVVDIDAPISDYTDAYDLPAFYCKRRSTSDLCIEVGHTGGLPEGERKITLRQLMSHTAGLIREGNHGPVENSLNPYLARGIRTDFDYWRTTPLESAPGTEHRYSNMGPNVAGVVIEDALGLPNQLWTAVVKPNIVDPLGLTTLQPNFYWAYQVNGSGPWIPYPDDDPAIAGRTSPRHRTVRYAAGPDRNPEELTFSASGQPVEEENYYAWPSGSLVSSVQDFARYCDALIDGSILPRETLDEEMWVPDSTDPPYPGAPYGYGLGFEVNDPAHQQGFGLDGTHAHVSHGGALAGGLALLDVLPDDGICIVSMANTSVDPCPDLDGDGYSDCPLPRINGAIGRIALERAGSIGATQSGPATVTRSLVPAASVERTVLEMEAYGLYHLSSALQRSGAYYDLIFERVSESARIQSLPVPMHFVDLGRTFPGLGTFTTPYASVSEGIQKAPARSTLKIRAGSSPSPAVWDSPIRLEAWGSGGVRLGAP